MPKRIVAIVGMAAETRELANKEPADVEIWGMNADNIFLTRQDRWFQIHPKNWHDCDDESYGRGAGHVDFLASCGVPVYQQERDERIPTSVVYPIERVWENIWPRKDQPRPYYFTSTPAFAIAQAIQEGVDEIRMFGFNLATSIEYVHQRACVEWLLGIAQGRGIKVVVPKVSPLLSAPLYAHENATTYQDIAMERVKSIRNRHMNGFASWYMLCGAVQEMHNWGGNAENVFCEPCAKRAQRIVQERLGAHETLNQKLINEVNNLAGGLKEAMHWLSRFEGIDVSAVDAPSLNVPDGARRPTEIWALTNEPEEQGDEDTS